MKIKLCHEVTYRENLYREVWYHEVLYLKSHIEKSHFVKSEFELCREVITCFQRLLQFTILSLRRIHNKTNWGTIWWLRETITAAIEHGEGPWTGVKATTYLVEKEKKTFSWRYGSVLTRSRWSPIESVRLLYRCLYIDCISHL